MGRRYHGQFCRPLVHLERPQDWQDTALQIEKIIVSSNKRNPAPGLPLAAPAQLSFQKPGAWLTGNTT